MMMMGSMELLLLLLFAGGPAGDLMGMPPGERDTNLVHAASSDSILYLEWAERSAGKPGAPGVDGMFADPEVQNFVKRIKAAIQRSITENIPKDDPARAIMESIAEFAISVYSRPGCLFAALGEEPGPGGMPDIRAGLIINGGESADELQNTIASLLAKIPGLTKLEKFDRTPLPVPIRTVIHREGNYLILAVGPKMLDKILAGLKAGKGGMADHAEFTAAWNQLKMERTGMASFLDFKNGVERLMPLTGGMGQRVPDILDATGLANIGSVTSVVGVVDGQARSRVKVKIEGEPKGLMSLTTGRAIKADDLKFVPADSDVVVAFSADAKRVLKEVRNMFETAQPGMGEEFDEEVQEFNRQFGVDLEADIFEGFGEVVTISNSPGDGGFVGTMPVLTLEVRKPASAFRTVAKLAEFFDREGTERNEDGTKRQGRGQYLERKEFMGQRCYMLNVVGDEDFVAAPTFMVTRTHFMLALHPAALKSRLRRMKRDDWKPFLLPPEAKGEVFGMSSIKISKFLPEVYGFLPWVAQSILSDAQRGGIQIDSFDFPSAQAILPYVGDAGSTATRVEDGILIEGTAPPLMGSMMAVPSLAVFGLSARPARAFRAMPAGAVEEAVEVIR